ncbi:hypothetical protein AVEN_171661-1 [Araneus ventricosus]|uniref:Uncharacterized protein n=1 Tax=Araneus ventricosus TaxID=182803 RepID=A0A4Y2I585_ARAVE|nr:hypothetical protein AVEN_171661-1 [Araneus ventricosus]
MGDRIYEFVKTGFQKISDVLSSSVVIGGLLNKIEERTGIAGSFIITGLTILVFLCFLLGSGPFFLLYSAVVLYPAYQSKDYWHIHSYGRDVSSSKNVHCAPEFYQLDKLDIVA